MNEFSQNESDADLREVDFQMVSDTDGITGATGLTITVEIVKAGESAYAAIEGGSSEPITEVGDGTYKVELGAGDLDTLGGGTLKFTATNALNNFINFTVKPQVDSTDTEQLTLEKAVEAILAVVAGKATVSDVDSDTKRIVFKGRDGSTTIVQVDVSTTTSGSREASTIS